MQSASRKRARSQSGDAVQPKEEPEDEPVSQRPRVEQRQPVSTAGSLSRTPEADEPSPLGATGGNPVSPDAEGPGLTGNGSTPAGTTQAAVAHDQHGGAAFSPSADVKIQDAETLPGSSTGASKDGVESTGTPGESLDSSQRVEEHFQPSLPMQEMVVNFLLRMAFVIGGDRDHDLQVGWPVGCVS